MCSKSWPQSGCKGRNGTTGKAAHRNRSGLGEGCRFSNWRKSQSMGSQRGYQNNPTGKSITRRCLSMRYRPSSQRLRASDNTEPSKLAFEFLILTATRTDEVLGLPWSEVAGDVWTLPAERTKPKRAHRVPLGPRCLEILRRAGELSDGSDYVFPGRSRGKPLSNMVFLMALRRMDLQFKVTGHGFRSTFRDWASECTNFSGEVSEMALIHTVKDKTEAAYRRGDLFDKRRELMLDWEQFVASGVSRRRKTRTA